MSADIVATYRYWEDCSVESHWGQGWCRVELYDLYTFSEQDWLDFDGFCIMYLWKRQTFQSIGCVQFQLYVLICAAILVKPCKSSLSILITWSSATVSLSLSPLRFQPSPRSWQRRHCVKWQPLKPRTLACCCRRSIVTAKHSEPGAMQDLMCITGDILLALICIIVYLHCVSQC